MGDSGVVQQWSAYHEELKSILGDIVKQTRAAQQSCGDLPAAQQKLLLLESDLSHLKAMCARNEQDIGTRIKELENKCDSRGCKMSEHELTNQAACIRMRDEIREQLRASEEKLVKKVRNTENDLESKINKLAEAVGNINVRLAYAGGIGAMIGTVGMIVLKMALDTVHKHISGGGQ